VLDSSAAVACVTQPETNKGDPDAVRRRGWFGDERAENKHRKASWKIKKKKEA
jgi:hypothetical protein